MRTATSHGSRPRRTSAMPPRRRGSSDVTTRAVVPKRVRSSVGDPAGVLLVGRDHEPAGVGLLAAHLGRAARARRASTLGSHSPSSESAVRSR